MAITFVGQVAGTVYGSSLTKLYTSTAGNTLILSLQHQSFSSPTITDTAGNTWIQGPDAEVDRTGAVAEKMVGLWYVFNALPITSVTVTTSGAGSKAIQFNLSEWRGIASLRDKSSAYIASPTTNSAVATVSSQPGDLVIGGVGYYDGTGKSDSLIAGYTALTANNVSTTYQSTGYRLVTTTATTGPSYTFSRATSSALAVASFVPSVVRTIAIAATATYNPTGPQDATGTGIVVPIPSGATVGQYVISAVYFAQGTGPGAIVTPANWTVLTPSSLQGTSANRLVVLYGYKITDATALSNLGTSFYAKVGYSSTRIVAISHLLNNVDLNATPSIGLLEFSASNATSVTFNAPSDGDFKLYFPSTNSSSPTPNAIMTSVGGTKNVQIQSLNSSPGNSADSQMASITGGTGVSFSATIVNHVSFGVGFMASFGATNVAPTATFTYNQTGLAISVDGTGSTDSDGTIASYSWNWGDSSTLGSGSTATHTYTAAGTYTVLLTVTDNGALTGISSASVIVSATTRPALVGTPTTGVQTSGGALSLTIAKPSGLSDGEWLIASLRNQDAAATTDFALAGWNRVGPAFVASSTNGRVNGFYAKYIGNASAETATNYTFTWTGGGGRAVGVIVRVQGADSTSLVDAYGPSYLSDNITNGDSLPSYTVTSNNGLQLAIATNEQTSPNASESASVTAGYTLVQSIFSTTGTGVSRTTLELYQKNQDAGSTTQMDVVWAANSASNIQSIVLKAASTSFSSSPVPHFAAGDYAEATGGNVTTISVSKPVNTVDGDLLVAFVYCQSGAGSNFTTVPSGWTLSYTLSIRRGGVYTKPITSAAAETATTYTWSGVSAGRIVATIFRVTGADLANPIDVSGTQLAGDASNATSITVPSLTPTLTNDLLLGFNYWNNSSTTTVSTFSAASGMTDGIQTVSPVGGTSNTSGTDIQYQSLTTATATGTRVPTLSPSGVAVNGFLLTIRKASTPSIIGYPGVYRDTGGVNRQGSLFYWDGTTKQSIDSALINIFSPVTVSQFLSATHSPWFAAHRGFSNNYPEESLYSYRSATDWGIKAIEVSVQYSSDGTPWCFHDPTTTRTTGTTGTISAMTDAQISVLNNLGSTANQNSGQPSRPTAKLVDVLDTYYKTHVIIIEDKTYTHTTSILNLMDSYGTVGRPASEIFIWKADGLSGPSGYTAAASRGYHRWAYIFDGNMAASFTGLVTSGKADLIGMDYASSDATLSAAIAQCISNNVMPTGHIISSATQRDRLLGLGMKGLMMSNKDAVPPWYTLWVD